MARINYKGQLSGSIGPISHRILDGVAIIQTKPAKGKLKQTEATKESASEFGIASKTAKQIRLGLFPIIQNLGDSHLHSRFGTSVYQATIRDNSEPKGKRILINGNFELLNDFEFNNNSEYSKYCNVKADFELNEEMELQISIPEFSSKDQIYSVEEASNAEIAYLITAFDESSFKVTYEAIFKHQFSTGDTSIPAQQWKSAKIAPNQLLFITTAVFYIRKNNLAGPIVLNNKQLHPCKVAGVIRS